MANSSDWIAAFQNPPAHSDDAPKGWIGALLEQSEFVEGLPFARAVTEQHEACEDHTPQSAAPVSDPIAEAFARGEAEGRAAMEAENAAALANQRGLRLNLRNLDQVAMDSLANEIAETVIGLCSQAITDFTPNAEQILARCQEAAARLGTAAQDCALHLNPEDLSLLDPDTLNHWRVIPSEEIERGGLHFESADGSISDGPPEWRRAISNALRG